MNDSKTRQPLSEHDRLITRPNEPLPANPDPHSPRDHPTDPKPEPPRQGQGTDPKAGDIGHVA